MRLDELRNEIAIGTEQLERGEATAYASGKEVTAKIKAEGRTRITEHQTAQSWKNFSSLKPLMPT